MVELFYKEEKCAICSKEFEHYQRILQFPVFRKEPHKGFDYEEPVLIDTDDIDYVHEDCLIVRKKQ